MSNPGTGAVGRSRVKRRLWIIFEDQLFRFGGRLAVAVYHHAIVDQKGAGLRKCSVARPVSEAINVERALSPAGTFVTFRHAAIRVLSSSSTGKSSLGSGRCV